MNGPDTISAAHRLTGGFLSSEEVKSIAADPVTRLFQLLVRCGRGRFICAAQDVEHFVAIITEHGNRPDSAETDYVRDVSLPTQERAL